MQLSEIAARLDCVLKGEGTAEITAVVGIEEADSGHLTFVSNPKYASKAKATRASGLIVSPEFPELSIPTLRDSNPYLTFARAIELFYTPPKAKPGVDPAARIASSAKIGEGASIGPFVVIEDDVVIGAHCTVHPFCPYLAWRAYRQQLHGVRPLHSSRILPTRQ